MRNQIFKIVFLVFANSLFLKAQEFVSQFNFTDAFGNKDSIFLGYDPLATDSLDLIFNETDIKNIPINPIIDVRISKKQAGFGYPGNWPTIYQTKKQIQFKRCLTNNFPIIQIEIKAKYQPITVSWNKVPYNTLCINGSVFTSIMPGGWWDTGSPSNLFRKELANVNTGTFTANYNLSTPPNNSNYAYINGSDTISIFWFKFSDISLLTTNIIEQSNMTGFTLYPNPTNGVLNLDLNDFVSTENYHLKIVNILGQSLIEAKLEKILNIANLKNGIYFLQLFEKEKLITTEKIIKE